jgi:hypothetical protein
MNVELLDEFRLSFILYALSRVELPVAMLTQTQSYWRQPHDPELAMGHRRQFRPSAQRYSCLPSLLIEDRRDPFGFNTPACSEGTRQSGRPWSGNTRAHSACHVLPASAAFAVHAILRAFVAVFRAARGFFRAAAAVFLALAAVSAGDRNSILGCFLVRWWPWCSGWMRAASSSIRS